MGPRDRELTLDEEMIEVIEVIESCEGYSDLDSGVSDNYEFDYLPEF